MFRDLKHKQIQTCLTQNQKPYFSRQERTTKILWVCGYPIYGPLNQNSLCLSVHFQVFLSFCFVSPSNCLLFFSRLFHWLTVSSVYLTHKMCLSYFCLSSLHVICTTVNDFYYFSSIFPPLRSRWRNSSWKRLIQTLIEYFGFSQQNIQIINWRKISYWRKNSSNNLSKHKI